MARRPTISMPRVPDPAATVVVGVESIAAAVPRILSAAADSSDLDTPLNQEPGERVHTQSD